MVRLAGNICRSFIINIDECMQRRVGFYAVHMGIVYTDAHASS